MYPLVEVVLVVAVADQDWEMRPLPLAPGNAVRLAAGVAVLIEGDGSGSVFLWGMAAWSWDGGDETGRRLAAVGLVRSGQADHRRVAEVFGVNETTLWRWRGDYDRNGVEGLLGQRKGPKGPWKVTEATVAEIVSARARGTSLREIAAGVGVSTDTVRPLHQHAARARDQRPSTKDRRRRRQRGDEARMPIGAVDRSSSQRPRAARRASMTRSSSPSPAEVPLSSW